MWMAELAARSGLSVATIKYYLREGLLHPGEAVGQTRTRYDDSHVRRLRLIRALTDVANLR
ncbi:MAG: MerR family transcriptional regulator, partial [Nocardiaceae bacterium]|nr:MerR family transcriptional regulator [Nocardiaceae bacterium]